MSESHTNETLIGKVKELEQEIRVLRAENTEFRNTWKLMHELNTDTRGADRVLRDAVEAFGPEPQMRQLQEECGELVAALNQYLRGRKQSGPVIQEVADVMIMCEQMAFIFPKDELMFFRQQKLARLAQILKDRPQ